MQVEKKTTKNILYVTYMDNEHQLQYIKPVYKR